MSDSNATGSGISATAVLGIVFVVLKLTHVIAWSWFYVTMPFWLGFAVVASVILVFIAFALIAHMVSK